MQETQPLTLDSLKRALEILKEQTNGSVLIEPKLLHLQMPVIFSPYAFTEPRYVPGFGIFAKDEESLQAYFDRNR